MTHIKKNVKYSNNNIFQFVLESIEHKIYVILSTLFNQMFFY